jgi:glycosyltransferase involved in cell wall biosynthesis
MTGEAMPTNCDSTENVAEEADGMGARAPISAVEIEVGLLTGCQDRPYALELAMSLIAQGVSLDVIGSDEVDSPEMHTTRRLHFLNFRGNQRQDVGFAEKAWKLLVYYARLVRYAVNEKPKIFHILWNNKVEYFDRTVLMLYYKLLGKKIVLTAHNVNQGRRDGTDSLLNRLTLKVQYRLADHIFIHTQKMKAELLSEFGVAGRAATVIRHPINNAFPDTDLTPAEAKRRLGIREVEKTILFFGRITPYKGLEDLLEALKRLLASDLTYRLIIAGAPKKGTEGYWSQISRTISDDFTEGQIIPKLQFIPDEDMELYLKAADVLVLPYKEIFQSGVLFLGYSYGLPVIATDVGSFREEIVEGETGFLCRPNDPLALADTIETYFTSDLYKDLKRRRQEIRNYANVHHTWNAVAELTRNVYAELIERHPA